MSFSPTEKAAGEVRLKARALSDLMHILDNHFALTFEGMVSKYDAEDPERGAWLWLFHHRPQLAAMSGAASIIAEALADEAADLDELILKS